MNVKQKLISPIVNGYKGISKSSTEYRRVATRTAKMKGLNPFQTTVLETKNSVVGGFRPVIKKVKNSSDSFNLAIDTVNDVKRKGYKKSKPKIKDAVQEFVGINDVKAAIKDGGKIKGVQEGVKATARLFATLGGFIAGNFIPFPCASIAGWVAGEKITEKCLGKPFTKQVKKILK